MRLYQNSTWLFSLILYDFLLLFPLSFSLSWVSLFPLFLFLLLPLFLSFPLFLLLPLFLSFLQSLFSFLTFSFLIFSYVPLCTFFFLFFFSFTFASFLPQYSWTDASTYGWSIREWWWVNFWPYALRDLSLSFSVFFPLIHSSRLWFAPFFSYSSFILSLVFSYSSPFFFWDQAYYRLAQFSI